MAPRLTAKGHGEVAEKIVAIAESAGVHVEHNAPLAQALSHIDFGEQIPKELYRAVAEVIGFVQGRIMLNAGMVNAPGSYFPPPCFCESSCRFWPGSTIPESR